MIQNRLCVRPLCATGVLAKRCRHSYSHTPVFIPRRDGDAVSTGARPAFSTVADRWLAANDQWSPGYRRQVEHYLDRDVLPAIGHKAISGLSPEQLRVAVKRVADRNAPCAAVLVAQWLLQIFTYAAAHGLVRDNPAMAVKGMIRRPAPQHHRPLGWSSLPAFLIRLDTRHGSPDVTVALRLLALTFVRPSELRLAQWPEFDLAGALWEIPKERMKMRRPHLVPLSRQAVDLLRQIRRPLGTQPWLFPNHRVADKAISASSLNRVIGNLGYAGQFSAHGFRATATTLLGLLGYPDKLVDLQLAHRKGDASRAPYDHARFMASRAVLMQDWADILDALRAGHGCIGVTRDFGPLSRRRSLLLRVCERE